MNSFLQSLTVPDLWQQQAVHALREGRDVVVHAPTGAGKTYIFELLYPNLRGQAIFTVPTRALANDKLAEWQARGWDVGIATGDVALRLDAKVVVATLETQKGRLLQGRGPSLLVIDEYQMLADAVRGVNYEVAIALTPPKTQLLLLSGSVANPEDVVSWLQRIGRQAVLVAHYERPVPLQEIELQQLPERAASTARGWWPRQIASALRAELGPVLLFAPRRHSAEDLALQVAAALPVERPLPLTREQSQLAGPRLAKLLHARVAYHHSGLSYAQRAGLIEPLAKAGELRVVVATMGLAAGINFSMRSVAITGTSYIAGNFERQVRADELLQMYGRAGRRGLDESGYALVGADPPRLYDARPRHLRRASQVDWPTLVAVMSAAAARGESPLAAAREVNGRLFSIQTVPLGCEHSLATGPMPCGLHVDAERARFPRRGVTEMRNSAGEWETQPAASRPAPLGKVLAWRSEAGEGEGSWLPALSLPATLTGFGAGKVCRLPAGPQEPVRYGREVPLGTRAGGTLALAPWLRKPLGREAVDLPALEQEVLARIPELTGGGRLRKLYPLGDALVGILTYEDRLAEAWLDAHSQALLDPPLRRELPRPCRSGGPAGGPCPQLEWCLGVEIASSPASAWRQLGLIEADGRPTRRGAIFSYFQHGEGLAVAAALEQASYPIEELVFDLANLRGGPRFAGDESPFAGRLAVTCQNTFGRLDFENYLAMGVPTDYGAGASEAVRQIVQFGVPRQKLLTEALRAGDLERAVVEWRSLLRHVTHAPDYPWERWRELQAAAARFESA